VSRGTRKQRRLGNSARKVQLGREGVTSRKAFTHPQFRRQ